MNDIDLTQLNSTIRAELARRGMHQRDLAALLGLSQPSVSARFSGAAEWRVSEIQAVARALGIRISLSVSPVATSAPADEVLAS